MPWKTPEEEAVYALDYSVDRSELSADAQVAYDRLLAEQVKPGKHSATSAVVLALSEQLSPPSRQLSSKIDETREERMETYARKTMIYAHQTAIATQVIAWIIAIGVILAVILGIIAAVNLGHIANQGNPLP